MIDKLAMLDEILERMIADDITISFQAVVRHSERFFRHASDLTRVTPRKERVDAAIVRQDKIRQSLTAAKGLSMDAMASVLASQDVELNELRRRTLFQADLLRKLTDLVSENGRTALHAYMRKQLEILDTLDAERFADLDDRH